MFHREPAPYMKDQVRQEWTTLMQEGAQGQATRFRLRALRLAQLLRKSDPELAEALTAGLSETSSLTRLSPPSPSSAGAPDLLTIENVTSLPIEPYWPTQVESELRQLVNEWASLQILEEAGLHPARTALLYGPPGVGKTLAARWLSQQLKMPLASLNLSATLNSYLGKTGQNITRVLDYARSTPCVLFLDEFDALGKRRDDDQDVGELKRVVNVLLQTIDHWNGPSLLVAATNHESLLDQAMLRRFEVSIEFPEPSSQQVSRILKSIGVPASLAPALSMRLKGRPISDATRLVMQARKRALLDKVSFVTALKLCADEQISTKSSIQMRRDLVRALHVSGQSAHQIARRLKKSHTTILRDLKAIEGE